jgi:hypothetical protein
VHIRHKSFALFLVLVASFGCRKDLGPVEVVQQFHKFTSQEMYTEALLLVDFDAKCRTMLGDLYVQGDIDDQREMQDIWSRKLEETTRTYLSRHFGDATGKIVLETGSEAIAEVSQTKGKFKLIYSLQKGEGGWLIVDRINEIDGARPNPSRSMRVLLKRIEGELGHPPTLAEVNARLEDYMERMKVRRIPVNAAPAKR